MLPASLTLDSLQQQYPILDLSADSIIIHDLDGNIIFANKSAYESRGYMKEEMSGMKLSKILAPEQTELSTQKIAEIFENGELRFESVHLRKDDSVFPVETHVKLIEIQGNKYCCSVIRDITKRKQAEEALLQSEARYRRITEGLTDYQYTVRIENGRAVETKHSPACATVTGYTAEEFAADPYLWIRMVAPEDRELTIKRVGQLLEGNDILPIEHRIMRKDGIVRWVSDNIILYRDLSGILLSYDGVVKDITDRKQAEEKIRYLATHDALTNLPTLRLVKDRILMAMEMAKRNKTLAAIMYIDLDGFKDVNDNYGHEAGDILLKEVGKRLVSSVRKVDTVARIGGDEFLLLITELQSPESAALIATKVLQFVSEPFDLDGKHATVGASIGIALYPDHGNDAATLIKQADKAMYVIKNSGKNGYTFVNMAK